MTSASDSDSPSSVPPERAPERDPAAHALAADEPAEPVQPIYLRRGPRPHRRGPQPQRLRPPQHQAAGHDSLVDAITERVVLALAPAVRQSVHEAVLELAPRMSVGLPEQPWSLADAAADEARLAMERDRAPAAAARDD